MFNLKIWRLFVLQLEAFIIEYDRGLVLASHHRHVPREAAQVSISPFGTRLRLLDELVSKASGTGEQMLAGLASIHAHTRHI